MVVHAVRIAALSLLALGLGCENVSLPLAMSPGDGGGAVDAGATDATLVADAALPLDTTAAPPVSCATVGCGQPPLCEQGCQSPCGCCGCNEGELLGDSFRCTGGCYARITPPIRDAGAPDLQPPLVDPPPYACTDLLNNAPPVRLELVPDPRPPELVPQGGEVSDGTYELTSFRIYGARGGGLEGLTLRYTLRISAVHTQLEIAVDVGGTGAGQPDRVRSSLVQDGNQLVATQLCPTMRPPTPQSYTATPGQLILFSDNPSLVFVMTRR